MNKKKEKGHLQDGIGLYKKKPKYKFSNNYGDNKMNVTYFNLCFLRTAIK